jgi:hypothetical protein
LNKVLGHRKPSLTICEGVFLKIFGCSRCFVPEKLNFRYEIYKKAVETFNKESSLEEIIKSIRMTKILAKILLPENMRKLIKKLTIKDSFYK